MSTTVQSLTGEMCSTFIPQPAVLGHSEEMQQRHYDAIAGKYETHYSDPASLEYRRRFICEPMFQGINLAGMKVLDAMCGSGQTTHYLLMKDAQVTGLDISQEVINSFKARWRNCEAASRSILESGFPSNTFDAVVVVGGLHHMHPEVNRALTEIHRVLRPGGYFCFMEPHKGSFADLIRKAWYKVDRMFMDNEAAIDLTTLEREFAPKFEVKRVRYSGNIAFLLVLNSLIFRIPVKAKPYYSALLMKIEQLLSPLQRKLTSCFVVAQWQKR